MVSSREDFLQVGIGGAPFWSTFEQNAASELDLRRRQVGMLRRFFTKTQPGKSCEQLLGRQRLKAVAPENGNGTSKARTLLHQPG